MAKLSILSASETELFLQSMFFPCQKETSALKQTRNHCLCCLMLYAGLRVSEAVKLIISDVHNPDFPITTLTIRKEIAKKQHERHIPINHALARAIEMYKRKLFLGNILLSTDFLFPAKSPGKHLTVRQVQRIVEHHSVLSLSRKIHPHALRHTFATRLMRVTNIRVVQELLGHKNLSSTQIYTHPNSDDLRLAVSAIT